jgi:acyl-CoA reductase-like NAD-dependent aldehyde dehydrogenase
VSQGLKVVSPADGSVYAERPLADRMALDAVLSIAVKAQRSFRRTSLDERIAIAEAFAVELARDADAQGVELAMQMGRPVRYAANEVRTAADRARTMTSLAHESLAEIRPEARLGFDRYIRRVPLGVVLVVPAWNYPYLIAVNSVIPALLAGNAVVLKHSSQTPLVAERFGDALALAGLPEGVFQCLHAGHDVTELAVRDPRVDFVAFTGSVKGGHAMVGASADRFVNLGLELGGKDPAYVRADADLDYAVENLVDGAFFNSGQSCCGIERIYAHKDVYDRFVAGFVESTRAHVLGDPRDPETTLGPMVRGAAAHFVRSEVAAALADGATAQIAEEEFPASQLGTPYLAPQVLTDVGHRMSIMGDETFGPCVGIMRVETDDQAIGLMNDSAFGLTASVWTQDVDEAVAIGDQIETGTWFMNRCDSLDPALAWVGVKDSGRGCSLSRIGFEQLTRPKSYHLKTDTKT